VTTIESSEAWRAVAAGWERHRAFMWAATRRVSDRLVDLLAPRPGDTVLELAAALGDTGFLAAERVGPSGRLISSDFIPEMVESARRRAAELGLENVDFEVLDAQTLGLDDASVDGVLCRWGYMLVPDLAAACAETRRVLRPGGRVALAAWATADENPWAASIGRVLLARGLVDPPDADSPGPFRLADPRRLRGLLETAGLDVLVEEDVSLTWRYESFDDYWDISRDLSRTLAVALESIDEELAKRIRGEISELLEPYRTGDALLIPGLTRVVLARRANTTR
jgi:SAM-dependent methyltransferase